MQFQGSRLTYGLLCWADIAFVPALTSAISCYFLSFCRDGTAQASTSGAPAAGERAPPLSLDRFCAMHTSEDNASFAEVLAASNQRRRSAQPWLFEDKNQVSCSVCQPAAGAVVWPAAAGVMPGGW